MAAPTDAYSDFKLKKDSSSGDTSTQICPLFLSDYGTLDNFKSLFYCDLAKTIKSDSGEDIIFGFIREGTTNYSMHSRTRDKGIEVGEGSTGYLYFTPNDGGLNTFALPTITSTIYAYKNFIMATVKCLSAYYLSTTHFGFAVFDSAGTQMFQVGDANTLLAQAERTGDFYQNDADLEDYSTIIVKPFAINGEGTFYNTAQTVTVVNDYLYLFEAERKDNYDDADTELVTAATIYMKKSEYLDLENQITSEYPNFFATTINAYADATLTTKIGEGWYKEVGVVFNSAADRWWQVNSLGYFVAYKDVPHEVLKVTVRISGSSSNLAISVTSNMATTVDTTINWNYTVQDADGIGISYVAMSNTIPSGETTAGTIDLPTILYPTNSVSVMPIFQSITPNGTSYEMFGTTL